MNAEQGLMRRLAGAEPELMSRLTWMIGAGAIAFYLAPYLLLGSQLRWMIWDNLDSTFVWYKLLLESGELFGANSAVIAQPLGGLPRGTFPSELDALVWLYQLFGPEGAYVVNRVIQSVVGFLGMYLLLKRHVLRADADTTVVTGVALCFSLLPFWPFGGLSVAGMPLALNAMLNMRSAQPRLHDWLVIFAYPFYSSLILSGVFFLFAVSIIWLTDVFRKRKSALLFRALVLMSVAYVITHYRLFLGFLIDPGFVSHRVEFSNTLSGLPSLGSSLRSALSIFVGGQAHAHSLHWPVIMVVSAIAALLVSRVGTKRLTLLFIAVWLFIVTTSLFYGLSQWPVLNDLLGIITRQVPIQLQRFHFLHPMLWMVLFGIALAALVRQAVTLRWVALSAVIVQIVIAFSYHEHIVNRNGPSAAEFFATEQFGAVAEAIGKPKDSYRVASLGLHPSVALYNGFYTVDGYWPNYPLKYKHRFRGVIAAELEKNTELLRYYDAWGSRVYVFSNELKRYGGYVLNYKDNSTVVRHLDLDASALKGLGARYLISAVKVDVLQNRYLKPMGKFESDSSAWDIYLYEIIVDA
jgi:hypothetical protein